MEMETDARERSRLAALAALGVMDSSPEQAYDDLTRAAARLFDAPIALVSLVDEHRQWFKSRVGLQALQTPREHSFCTHAIREPAQTMVVRDASIDGRFRANPLVTGEPGIRFYAGVPLVLSSGEAIGTLCVIDTVAREPAGERLAELRFLADQVVRVLERR